jgi:hypothetical protein
MAVFEQKLFIIGYNARELLITLSLLLLFQWRRDFAAEHYYRLRTYASA